MYYQSVRGCEICKLAHASHSRPATAQDGGGVEGSLSLGCRIKLIEKVVSRSMYCDVTREGGRGERGKAGHAMQDIGGTGTTLAGGLFPRDPRLLEIHCSTSVRALAACPLHLKPLSSSRQL